MRYKSRTPMLSYEEAIRLAIARMGDNEPEIGRVETAIVDEESTFNTTNSGYYK